MKPFGCKYMRSRSVAQNLFFEVLAGGLLVVAVILKRRLIIIVVAADVPATKSGSITPAISSLQSGRD
jgi:hypothetical protein